MGKLEKLTRAQLNSALTPAAASLQRSLSSEDLSQLLAMMDGLSRRYPSQELAESMAEFQADYERLCLRYSLRRVQEAIDDLRIDPDQKFFPRPDEVASRIERRRVIGTCPGVDETHNLLLRERWEMQRIINSAEEKSWRKDHFGYDPYTEKPSV